MPGLSILMKGKLKRYMYIFFNLDSLTKYERGGADMSYLIGSKKYLKRLEYSFDELKKIHWQIKYQ